MTKDEKFRIGLALNRISIKVNDATFQKIKDDIKEIEEIVKASDESPMNQ